MAFKRKRSLLNILIAALLGAAVYVVDSTGFSKGKEALQTPVIDASLLSRNNADYCSLITVHSLTTLSGKSYYQSGIGWVVKSDRNELQVITPAHVIHGAEVVIGQCDEHRFALEIKVESETKDFSVLSFKYPSEESFLNSNRTLMPVIDFGRSTQSRFMNKQWLNSKNNSHVWQLVTIDSQYEFYRTPMDNYTPSKEYSLASGFLSAKQSGVYGDGDHLVLEGIAIRPGYSGAPLLIDEKDLVGMLIRTESSGSRSIAIAIDDIVRNYQELLAVAEAALPETTNQAVKALDLKTSPLIKYETGAPSDNLIRFPTLIQPLSNGTQFTAQEACSDSYKESSEWTEFSKVLKTERLTDEPDNEFPAYGKSSFNYFKLNKVFLREKGLSKSQQSSKQLSQALNNSLLLAGGGDYAEGGGGPFGHYDSFLTMSLHERYKGSEGQIYSPRTYFYKNEKTCPISGLSSNRNGILIGYVDEQGIGHKVSDLNDLSWELKNKSSKQREEKINSIYSKGVFYQKDHFDFSPLCHSPALKDRPYLAFSGIASAVYSNRYFVVKEIAKTSDSLSKNFIRCSPDARRFDFSLDQQDLNFKKVTQQYYLNDPIVPTIKIRFSADETRRIRGTANIGSRCLINLDSKNVIAANIWKYQIRDKDFKADVNFDTKDRLIRIKVYAISADCASGRGNVPWLEDITVVEKAP